MSPLASYRTSMNSMYENEPVRIVVSTQFLLKMGLAGFLVSFSSINRSCMQHSLAACPAACCC